MIVGGCYLALVYLGRLVIYLFSLTDHSTFYVSVIKYVLTGVILVFGALGVGANFFDVLKAARARKVSDQVAVALNQIKQSPGQNIAEVPTEKVAAKVAEAAKDAKIDKEQLVRLVEQHKQQFLIDDEYFQRELSSLIVTFLQPLPRNAKRLLNRFRVNLLIAHSRGLLTSQPKVTTQQIGKWLVLMERWPQLGRSLSATPAKLQVLEQHAAPPVLANQDSSASDEFTDLIEILAPPYVDDEDLRKFIHSEPALAAVAQRLAHYGADELSSQPPASA